MERVENFTDKFLRWPIQEINWSGLHMQTTIAKLLALVLELEWPILNVT